MAELCNQHQNVVNYIKSWVEQPKAKVGNLSSSLLGLRSSVELTRWNSSSLKKTFQRNHQREEYFSSGGPPDWDFGQQKPNSLMLSLAALLPSALLFTATEDKQTESEYVEEIMETNEDGQGIQQSPPLLQSEFDESEGGTSSEEESSCDGETSGSGSGSGSDEDIELSRTTRSSAKADLSSPMGIDMSSLSIRSSEEDKKIDCLLLNKQSQNEASDDSSQRRRRRAGSPSLTLFIQMQLCSGTLRNWLQSPGRQVDVNSNREVLKQILLGIDHIHQRGFIHRDITPNNILLKTNGSITVKIGDFGLIKQKGSDYSDTTSSSKADTLSGSSDFHNPLHTSGVGTTIYAAPEQKSSINYDEKVDVFSVGIIYAEMCYSFQTEMERILTLMDLAQSCSLKNNFPFPSEVAMIERMIHHSPSQRPSISEILSTLDHHFSLQE
eukprot:TRINITY_DN6131_c0_g1_i1.p1 TRINITY_DN6131_c0_g1~~TRINITY_DN6131_c0_g1_i1.p1  ORF type:complete len:439 (+),score=86.94 TRINITY_DN6131_c0_g1_i1:340-1656(+)